MGEGLNLPEEFYDLSLSILGPTTRRLLSIHLDPTAVIPTANGVLGDLSGLAELAGFEFCHIRYFETKHSRTFACLEEWGSRQTGTIGNLLKNLITMERFDCLSEVKDSILRDIQNHVNRIRQSGEKGLNIEHVDKENNSIIADTPVKMTCLSDDQFKDGTVSNKSCEEEDNSDNDSGYKSCSLSLDRQEQASSTETCDNRIETSIPEQQTKKTECRSHTEQIQSKSYKEHMDCESHKEHMDCKSHKEHMDCKSYTGKMENQIIEMHPRAMSPVYEDDGFLTTDDREGNFKSYCACICCADEDLELAYTIIAKYKQEQHVNFFLPQAGLISGKYEFETLAEVIETRCNSRVIVILSRHYLTSPACVFATQFVKTLDPAAKCRKIIPVLLDEDLAYPRVLRGISSIKARRLKYGNAFWNLLSSSLRLKTLIDEENNVILSDKPSDTTMNNLGEKGRKHDRKNNVQQNDAIQKPLDISQKNATFSLCEDSSTSSLEGLTQSDKSFDRLGATAQSEQSVAATTGVSTKKRNPGLKTLRRIMKSLNIMERKPKLQYTKRSHSASDTIRESQQVFVETRSYSAGVPPILTSSVSFSDAISRTQRNENLSHTESELTIKNIPCDLSVSQSGNSLLNIEDSEWDNTSCNELTYDDNSSTLRSGQNILSPNIEPLSTKDISFDMNNFDSISRQISCDNNLTIYTEGRPFDNTSLLSEMTSSDNNSIMSRKRSFDNCSNASSFRQMPLDSNSRQTSFESNNSRQTSFDGHSMTSVEDNMAVDKQITKCLNELGTSKRKSEVMFEIML